MYVPSFCKSLAESSEPQIRLGVQGYGGTGKTWSALTFLNPVAVNIDRGLGAHSTRTDVIEVKFYDLEYCKKVNLNHKGPHDLKDTILLFLDKEAKKLEPDQTLIWDGGTGTQNAYHKWYDNKIYILRVAKKM